VRRGSPGCGRSLGLTGIYHILANPYCMGVVSYQGIHYEGKHQPLVEPDVWLAVQHVLAAHNHTGEKDRTHNHYLRSTIYCSSCGGRKVYSENKGNGGTYAYFFCVRPEYAEQIRTAVRQELASQQAEAGHSLERARRNKQRVEDERRKLLAAHYPGPSRKTCSPPR
jgi:site-specific DNA recombinase